MHVDALPNELLAAFFTAGLPCRSNVYDPQVPLLVSQVSRHWRDVAQNAPDLWTNIHVRLDRRGDLECEFLADFLARSKGCLIDVTLNCGSDKGLTLTRSEFISYLQPLVSHAGRWRSLTLRANFPPFSLETSPLLDSILICFHGTRAPRLESLYISTTPFVADEPSALPLFGGQLSHLRLHNFVALVYPAFAGLTALCLSSTSADTRWSYAGFKALLLSSPCLTRLALGHGVLEDFTGGNERAAIEVPSLKVLKIATRQLVPYVSRSLQLLCTPALERLQLQSITEGAYQSLIDAIAPAPDPKYPALHTFELMDVHVEPSIHDNFFLSLPSVHHVKLIRSYGIAEKILNHIRTSRSRQAEDGRGSWHLWPDLRVITAVGVGKSYLRGVLEASNAAKNPVQKLRVIRRELKQYETLRVLVDQMEVVESSAEIRAISKLYGRGGDTAEWEIDMIGE